MTDEPIVPIQPQRPDNDQEPKALSVYWLAGISAAVAVVVAVVALTAYHATWGKKQRTGVVDIAGVLEISEMVFTEMVSKPNVNDDDRRRAYDLVSQTGPKIEASIKQIQSDCDCMLLAKAAVVGGGGVDYTDQLRADLGLQNVDVPALKMRLQDAFAGKKDGEKAR